MTNWNGFKGAAKRIEDLDIPRIGQRIGVGEDELHAFMDVEAAGSGFDRQGRPKMLFEPHVFYRNLSADKRQQAMQVGLAYKKWGTRPYPKDSYPTLQKAMELDETAALKSASWGLGQILGENHKLVGYDTVQGMVLAFMDDEEKHLEAIVEYLISTGIDDDLKAHRWEVVARVYNGPGYAKHNYHGRMALAYAKWAKIKDTPYTPGTIPVSTVGVEPPEMPESIKEIIAPTPPIAQPSAKPIVSVEPGVFNLIVRVATKATAAAITSRGNGVSVPDIVGRAISEALTDPEIAKRASDTTEAVNSIPAAKPWWKSAGVLGAAGAVVVLGGNMLGVSLTEADLQEGYSLVAQAVASIFAIVGLVGRIRARTRVTT